MNERIKELAEQAGLLHLWVYGSEPTGSLMIKPIEQQIIERFAELVRQDERDACAKLCESIDAEYEGEDVLATWCADAIRARGNI